MPLDFRARQPSPERALRAATCRLARALLAIFMMDHSPGSGDTRGRGHGGETLGKPTEETSCYSTVVVTSMRVNGLSAPAGASLSACLQPGQLQPSSLSLALCRRSSSGTPPRASSSISIAYSSSVRAEPVRGMNA
ncbi:hypothetical protein BJX70DRAFT_326625 [Aspergillus crustosus]